MPDKLVVYTMSIGATFDLKAVQPHENVEFICLTDQPDMDANGWQLREVRNLLPTDPTRSSREFKICPHRIFADYDRSIYLDSSVKLRSDPEALWAHLMDGPKALFGGFYHPSRRKLIHEFVQVKRKNLDDPRIVDEQLEAYRDVFSELLENRPVWGGVLGRRHNHPACTAAMECWFANVLRFSRRDQLSLPIAVHQLHPSQVAVKKEKIRGCKYLRWPVTSTPKPTYYRVAPT